MAISWSRRPRVSWPSLVSGAGQSFSTWNHPSGSDTGVYRLGLPNLSALLARLRESLDVLHGREFRLLFAGQAVSVLGDRMVAVALVLAAGSVSRLLPKSRSLAPAAVAPIG